jgi:hypothetical protein
MKTFDLFPTLVTTETYEQHDEFKQVFFDNLPKYLRDDGITGEQSGHVDLHLNPDFEKFFQFVSSVANEYIDTLIGTKDIWEPWLVKSWFSDFSVPAHDHSDAHLSFVYYVNVPNDKQFPLHFIPPIDRLNDLVSGMFLNNKNIEVVREFNQYNCTSVAFTPEEGTIIFFPAKLKHMVSSGNYESDIRARRISLAGDIILTFKETTARSMGLQPLSNWRSMGL